MTGTVLNHLLTSSPNVGVIPDAIEAFILEATRYVGENEAAGPNRSVRIDYWNLETIGTWEDFPRGARGAPWCASFMFAAGRQSLGVAWPCPRTASAQVLVDWAKEHGIFYTQKPQRGDLFVIYYPELGRYGHVGVITGVKPKTIDTVEGNTNIDGSREGYGAYRKNRTPNERYGYIRWAEILGKV